MPKLNCIYLEACSSQQPRHTIRTKLWPRREEMPINQHSFRVQLTKLKMQFNLPKLSSELSTHRQLSNAVVKVNTQFFSNKSSGNTHFFKTLSKPGARVGTQFQILIWCIRLYCGVIKSGPSRWWLMSQLRKTKNQGKVSLGEIWSIY